jgi:DNA-binding MarR family transcriptional regulator
MDHDHVDSLSRQWARRRPELDLSGLSVAARVLRLQRILEREAADVLRPFELNEGEVQVLAALRRSPPPHELTPTELYRSLLLSSGAMTNRLDRLERAGLVQRLPDPDDGRRVIVRLTDEGRDVIDEAMDAHTASLRRLLSVLSDEERAGLEDHLRRLLSRLEADRDEV